MTAYELQVQEQIEETKRALVEYPGDEFITRELARLEGQLEQLASAPRRFLVATGRDSKAVDAYLGFGAQVVTGAESKRGKYVALIVVPAEHATWQSLRLGSGMMGGYVIFETQDEAAFQFQALVELG